jgi:hypothetical protein
MRLYRGYYALGGTLPVIGIPTFHAEWIFINRLAAIALPLAAAVPLAIYPWPRTC